MGNKNSKHSSSFADWEKVETQNQIEIYRSKKNSELAQKRAINIDPHFDLDDELKIYHMRQQNNDSLVRAFGVEEVHKKAHSQGICSGHKKLIVLTEKIPYRLSDLPQLTFPETLLFLRESLRAYLRVFKSYGPIHITKRLIGVNDFGQVKCWVNQNWALNHPNQDLPTLQSTKLQGFANQSIQTGASSYDARYRDQTQMVHNIVAVIEQKCEEGKFPQAFSQQVEHHSNSFRKLSTYVQDFIRINELFIPPKINYETVFVSKYQSRLVQQHHQSGQQTNLNQTKNVNHSVALPNHSINMTDFPKAAYSAGEYQNLVGKQRMNFSANHTQEQAGIGGGYTITKTTTYENKFGQNNNTISTNQPSTYRAHNASLSDAYVSNSTKKTPIPWQKSQSTYKLPQNQSSYQSSFYQYSATNPSSISVGNYQFGIGSSGNQVTKDPLKPSSYSGLNNVGHGSGSYNLSNNQNTFTSLQNKFGNSLNDNPLSPYQNLGAFNNQRYTEIRDYNSSTPYKQTYEQFKKNFGQSNTKSNAQGYTTANYNFSSMYEPLGLESAEKGSTFSFDGRKDFTTKFAQYSGKDYTNTLNNTYETSNHLNSADTNGMRVEGKYSQQFNSLLGPLMGLKNQFDRDQNRTTQLSNQGKLILNPAFSISQNKTLTNA